MAYREIRTRANTLGFASITRSGDKATVRPLMPMLNSPRSQVVIAVPPAGSGAQAPLWTAGLSPRTNEPIDAITRFQSLVGQVRRTPGAFTRSLVAPPPFPRSVSASLPDPVPLTVTTPALVQTGAAISTGTMMPLSTGSTAFAPAGGGGGAAMPAPPDAADPVSAAAAGSGSSPMLLLALAAAAFLLLGGRHSRKATA